MKLHRHPESFITRAQVGPAVNPYLPTHGIVPDDGYVNDRHRALAMAPSRPDDERLIALHDIDGWLTFPDALKLYEMAFFAPGDVLELGCFHGLSTCILAQAIYDSGQSDKSLTSVDLSAANTQITESNLRRLGFEGRTRVHSASADEFLDGAIERGERFCFAFVDHSHTYDAVLSACRRLPRVLEPGAFCQFHDYTNLAGNSDGNNVYDAVSDGLGDAFEFYGNYGCSGLYRFRA